MVVASLCAGSSAQVADDKWFLGLANSTFGVAELEAVSSIPGIPGFFVSNNQSDTFRVDGTNVTSLGTLEAGVGPVRVELASINAGGLSGLFAIASFGGSGVTITHYFFLDPTVATPQWVQISPSGNRPTIAGTLATKSSGTRAGMPILFGTNLNVNPNLNETWAFDGTAWSLISSWDINSVGHGPNGFRLHPPMGEASGGNLVLFSGGGPNPGGPWNADTWLFDGSNWSQQNPTTSPPARVEANMAFDPVRGRTVLTSGNSTSGPNPTFTNDTWAWSGGNWTALLVGNTANMPVFTTNVSSGAFDSRTGECVFVGNDQSPNAYSLHVLNHADALQIATQPLGCTSFTLSASNTPRLGQAVTFVVGTGPNPASTVTIFIGTLTSPLQDDATGPCFWFLANPLAIASRLGSGSVTFSSIPNDTGLLGLQIPCQAQEAQGGSLLSLSSVLGLTIGR